MGEPTANENILTNFKGLLWGAFIGVVSFQILSPNIWNYAHETFGRGYHFSYLVFTAVYFFMMPVVMLCWVCSNWKLLKKYLPPFNSKSDLSSVGKQFIWGLISFIITQIIFSIIVFRIPFHNWVYYTLLSAYCVCCLVLIIYCIIFSKDRIQDWCDRSIKKWNEDNYETVKKYFRQLISLCLGACVLLFLAVFSIYIIMKKIKRIIN